MQIRSNHGDSSKHLQQLMNEHQSLEVGRVFPSVGSASLRPRGRLYNRHCQRGVSQPFVDSSQDHNPREYVQEVRVLV